MVLEKRKLDYEKNLTGDILNIFKILENKKYPFRVKSINYTIEKTNPNILKTTYTRRYHIILIDKNGKETEVSFYIPELLPSGFFLVNGQYKYLTNQIIVNPVFYFKKDEGKLTTV